MNRVYVAGASSERNERAKPVIVALREMGFRITHDWTVAVDMHGANNEAKSLTKEQLAYCAYEDLVGVRMADILVLLAPQNFSTGAWVELGIALERGMEVFVSGSCDKCIFALLKDCRHFESDKELLSAMRKLIERPVPWGELYIGGQS